MVVCSEEYVYKKYLKKMEDFYVWQYIKEKDYDMVYTDTLWKVLQIHGVREKLLKAVRSFYKGRKVCIQASSKEGEWLQLKVGMQQGCVNLFIDEMVR